MSNNRFFASLRKKDDTPTPAPRTVLFTESDVRKIATRQYSDNIQVLGFTPIYLLICIYDSLLLNKHKANAYHQVGFSITNGDLHCDIDLEIPILDLAVKLTRQYSVETREDKTKYFRADRVEILIQDTPIEEYLNMRGLFSKIMTHHFIKEYKKIQNSEIEITDRRHIERIVLNSEIATARLKI